MQRPVTRTNPRDQARARARPRIDPRAVIRIGALGCATLVLAAAGPCNDDVTGGPTKDPGFVISSVGAPTGGTTTIARGASATYSVAVTVTRTTGTGPITAAVQLHGTSGILPLPFDAALAQTSLTIPAGAVTGTASLTLTCTTHGVLLPTLSGNLSDSGHGARVTQQAPPCPPGCGGVLRCPPGCGQAVTIDDPVSVAGTVTSTSPLANGLPVGSGSISILCL